MRRVLDLTEPWVCPPSLVRVFAKRRAAQELRVIKGVAGRVERELLQAEREQLARIMADDWPQRRVRRLAAWKRKYG